MKNWFRFTYIAILMISSSMCFAGQKEEYDELRYNVLEPITAHFGDSSSLTKLISSEMIEMQKSGWKIKNPKATSIDMRNEARAAVRTKIGGARFDEMDKTIPGFCKQYTERPFHGSKQEWVKDVLATVISVAWDYKVANCEAYIRIVLLALNFNRLNNAQLYSSLFKEAAVVKAKPPSDHYFVLVEGKSGTMFAVDPWIGQVTILDGVTKLSAITANPLIKDYPPKTLNKLNKLFESSDDNGVAYYDEIYVGKTTQWILRRDIPIGYEQFVYTYDPAPENAHSPERVIDIQDVKDKNLHMEDIYTHLRFPSWKVEYKKLFVKPRGSNPKEAEPKKLKDEEIEAEEEL